MGCSVCFLYVDRLKRGVCSCIVREWLIQNSIKMCCLVWPLVTAGWLGSHTTPIAVSLNGAYKQ